MSEIIIIFIKKKTGNDIYWDGFALSLKQGPVHWVSKNENPFILIGASSLPSARFFGGTCSASQSAVLPKTLISMS